MRSLKKVFGIVTAIMLILTVLPVNVFAAGSYTAYVGKTTLKVGNSTNLTISAVNAAGKFTVTSSNPAVATVSIGATWVDGANMDNRITVNGVGEGTATITVTPENVSDNEYNLLTNPTRITITVEKETIVDDDNDNNNKPTTNTTTKEPQKSSDATLKELSSSVVKIDFNKNTTVYNVKVDKTVTSLKLKAVANDSKASVKITGDENFVTGNNVVTIVVTAENGSTKTYKINVEKSKYGTGPLLDLDIKGYVISPEFDPSVHAYSVNVIGDTSVEVEYVLADSSSKVVVEGADNLLPGENIVKVIVTQKDGKVTTYTVKVNVVVVDEGKDSNVAWIVVIVILAVLIIGEGAYIILAAKKENAEEEKKETKTTKKVTKRGQTQNNSKK